MPFPRIVFVIVKLSTPLTAVPLRIPPLIGAHRSPKKFIDFGVIRPRVVGSCHERIGRFFYRGLWIIQQTAEISAVQAGGHLQSC